MRHEVEQMLCERYPALFAERFDSIEDTAMARGIECPDGWFSLLDMLCARLQEATDSGEQPQTVATQVKENLAACDFVCARELRRTNIAA